MQDQRVVLRAPFGFKYLGNGRFVKTRLEERCAKHNVILLHAVRGKRQRVAHMKSKALRCLHVFRCGSKRCFIADTDMLDLFFFLRRTHFFFRTFGKA